MSPRTTTLAILPGALLCVAITAAAMAIQMVEERAFAHPYVETLVLAILLGIIVRSAWQPGPRWYPGIAFSARFLLEVAVMMLGASISFSTILASGSDLLAGIIGAVVLALLASYTICRALGLAQRISILIACGNSICGNSAIAAVAPVIGASAEDIASSVAFTAVLGVIVVLALPMAFPIFHLTETQYGTLAGLTVYAVPQVLAATLPIGVLATQVGTLVKLVRVLMLGPVVVLASLCRGQLKGERLKGNQINRLRLGKLVPWFVIGFLFLATLRTLGLVPDLAIKPITYMSAALTIISMAALGLGVDVRVIARLGLRVTLAVTGSLVVLFIISIVLIRALRIG
jgi:uncharacterized integral membrane protein (TIGR00698 family)